MEQNTKGSESKPSEAGPRSIRFHYIKSGFFRVMHVDGAIGGPTPRGQIHMALFSERNPIPLVVTQTVEADGTVKPEPSELVVRDGLVREVEADIVLNVDTARSLAKWLSDNADLIELGPEVRHG